MKSQFKVSPHSASSFDKQVNNSNIKLPSFKDVIGFIQLCGTVSPEGWYLMSGKCLYITNSVGQSLSRNATSSIYSWNSSLFQYLKIHCFVHKSPPFQPTQNLLNTVHTFVFYLYKIQFNIILVNRKIWSKILGSLNQKRLLANGQQQITRPDQTRPDLLHTNMTPKCCLPFRF